MRRARLQCVHAFMKAHETIMNPLKFVIEHGTILAGVGTGI